MWSGFIWIGLGSSGSFFLWTFGTHKAIKVSLVGVSLLASQVGDFFVELFLEPQLTVYCDIK
jgi:hypothetical protein